MVKIICTFIFAVMFGVLVYGSSHSEAPGTAKMPQADITDFYMFRSYETGRQNYVTFLMNAQPLQNPIGGPNYFALSDSHFYELYIDNDGDAVEDITFQFVYGNSLAGTPRPVETINTDCDCSGDTNIEEVTQAPGIELDIGTGPNQKKIAVALKVVGPINQTNQASLNFKEYYSLNVIRGGRNEEPEAVYKAGDTTFTQFTKPFDYAGTKTFPNGYDAYANQYIYDITIPGCSSNGKVFVGQRKESFSIQLGNIFDLVNLNPITSKNCPENNQLAGLNIDTFALEIPISCIKGDSDVIGAWTAVRELRHVNEDHVPGRQVSRLGNPLINELVIGLRDKGIFNALPPTNDTRFLDYVTHPTLPAIIELLFNAPAPPVPRQDLVVTFLTGVPGLNQFPGNFTACEYMRINLSIPAAAKGSQNNLGVIGGDYAGFPNGRRPGDDIVDAALRVMMGALCTLNNTEVFGCDSDDAPVGGVALTDGAPQSDADFDAKFPYLRTPNPGAVENPNPTVCKSDGGDGTDGTDGADGNNSCAPCDCSDGNGSNTLKLGLF